MERYRQNKPWLRWRRRLRSGRNWILCMHSALAGRTGQKSSASGRRLYRAAVAEAYGRLGRRAEALQVLDDLQEASEKQYLSPMTGHLSTLLLGSAINQSLGWNKHMNSVTRRWYGSKVAPESDSLRSNERFQELLNRMNFPRWRRFRLTSRLRRRKPISALLGLAAPSSQATSFTSA
jgi:hypothetical protein